MEEGCSVGDPPGGAPLVFAEAAVGADGPLHAAPGGLLAARALCLLLGPAVDEGVSQ